MPVVMALADFSRSLGKIVLLQIGLILLVFWILGGLMFRFVSDMDHSEQSALVLLHARASERLMIDQDIYLREREIKEIHLMKEIIFSTGLTLALLLALITSLQIRNEIKALIKTYNHALVRLEASNTELEKEVTERTKALRETVGQLEIFSHSVSHDLRAPLRAIQGYSKTLLEDYHGSLDQTGNHYLSRIETAAHRLDKLIQDLLSYTRISRENSPLIAVSLDHLSRTIVEQNTNFQPPLAEVNFTGPLLPVMGRESALTIVLSNLIENAIKFVPTGVMPKVHLYTEKTPHRIRLWVEDNGIGIATENCERIFHIFEQINNSTLYGGTGIGLAIVKKSVESLGGKVGVQSVINKGSRFWIELDPVNTG